MFDMEPMFILIFLASFLIPLFILPKWIRHCHNCRLVGKDMHKMPPYDVAEGGGLSVLTGAVIGILSYVAIKTFYFKEPSGTIEILALIGVLLISAIVGLIDDLLGWKKGLSRSVRIFIVVFAAIPLMVINAGVSEMSIPFLGSVDFGLLYPLFLIPLGIVAVTTTFNMLAGYNGLESSQGILILSALSIVNYIVGNAWLSVVGLCFVFALVPLYIFNKYPAKVFPGDVLTYTIGAMIASMAILGNIEKIAVFFFIPYIIEVILKSRGKLKKESFAKVNEDGSLIKPYDKIYGLEHWAIVILSKFREKVYEREVVYLINIFQIILILLGFWIFM